VKIALPVESKGMEENICQSFGRTPYFLVYNTETKDDAYIDNSAISSQGGAGIKAAQVIVDNDVSILITPRCGENAAAVINGADIKIYKSISGTVKDNIKAFNEGRLSCLEEIHAGFHNHGGK
jgi:predicted Fe-Mo cluster-binding NifX family protein